VKGLAAGARNSSLAALARELSLVRLLPLALAIFALFGLLGPVIDILSLGHIPPAVVFRNTMLSGLVALGYVFGMMRRNWWLFAAAVAVQITWVAGFGGGTALAPDGVPNGAQLRADGIVVIVLMIVSYASFLAFNNLSASSYLRVRAEIDLAHEIHMVLVPPIDRRVGAFEFFGVSSPSGEVGGDLVDVVETGGSWLGYVADVSGHGVSSGVVMGMFKSALRMRLRQPGGLGDLLRDLNDVLFPLKSSAMYVTAACVRGGDGAALEYAVAGHLPILLVRGRGVEEVTTPQIPVGMFEDYAFASASIDCERGDLLAILTDGLIEVFDARDRELGLDAIKTLLGGSAGRPLSEIADAIVAKARAHGTQLDDQSLLLIRRG
jgi:serine phosphatase RsbU (regulator of sigma subunit)